VSAATGTEWLSILKGLALAAAVGALALVAMAATGSVDDLRSLGNIKNPFKKVNAALTEVMDREHAWAALTKEANSICARYPRDELVVRPALPRNRADYIRALGIALDRERSIQPALAALQPPSNYEGPYSRFLRNRQVAITALERVQKATRDKNREDFVVAARVLALRKSLIDHYAAAVRMPACVF
jgi:hypothetical protein